MVLVQVYDCVVSVVWPLFESDGCSLLITLPAILGG